MGQVPVTRKRKTNSRRPFRFPWETAKANRPGGWFPCLPDGYPAFPSDPKHRRAVYTTWRKGLDDQIIARAVLRNPFPWIDLASGRKAEPLAEVDPLLATAGVHPHLLANARAGLVPA